MAGLGGCPYAKGASGNVPTEDVVFMLHGMGIKTNCNLDALVETGQWMCDQLGGRQNLSKVAVARLAAKMTASDANADKSALDVAKVALCWPHISH